MKVESDKIPLAPTQRMAPPLPVAVLLMKLESDKILLAPFHATPPPEEALLLIKVHPIKLLLTAVVQEKIPPPLPRIEVLLIKMQSVNLKCAL